MTAYSYDDIETFTFIDSRAFKQGKEQNENIVYRKYWESVVFKDNQLGYYISVIREIHEDDDFDSIQSESIVGQKFYIKREFEKAENYFLSDDK